MEGVLIEIEVVFSDAGEIIEAMRVGALRLEAWMLWEISEFHARERRWEREGLNADSLDFGWLDLGEAGA